MMIVWEIIFLFCFVSRTRDWSKVLLGLRGFMNEGRREMISL